MQAAGLVLPPHLTRIEGETNSDEKENSAEEGEKKGRGDGEQTDAAVENDAAMEEEAPEVETPDHDVSTVESIGVEEADENVAPDAAGRVNEAEATADDSEKADEKDGGDDGEVQSATILVMQESENRSVWAYGVQSKGASESWVIEQIIEDLDTVGLKNDTVVVISDQEPSAQEVLRAIARSRETEYGTSIEASSVGDSNSNGSIERAIQGSGR